MIVFDNMIADVLSNKKTSNDIAELIIRGRKLNNSLVFVTQPYFCGTTKCYTKLDTLICY